MNEDSRPVSELGKDPRRKLPTMRTLLALLVLAGIVPALLGLGLLVWNVFERGRAQIMQETLQTTRAMVASVDRDLAIGENVAFALATSSNITVKDFAAFHEQARSVLRDGFPGFTIVLSDQTGQQLVNAIRPFGMDLPRHGDPDSLRRVFDTGKPVISDLYIGGVLKRPLVSVDVPVWRDGKVVYSLDIGFLPEHFGKILAEQHLSPDRLVAVFDAKGVIVARTHDPEKFVGRTGAPALLSRLREVTEGVLETDTLEGVPVYSIFSRSKVTGWSVAIGIPRAVVLAEMLHSLSFAILIIAALLAVGFGCAIVLGGRIGRSVEALTVPALSLGSGNPLILPRPYFAEAAEVATALKQVEGELERYRLDAVNQNEKLAAAKAEAERANLAKTKFLAAASHDLRQPVQSLVLLLDVLRTHAASPIVVKSMNTMEAALAGLDGLLTNLLDISRIDAGIVASHPEDIDIGALVQRLADEYATACQTKGLRLRCRGKAGLFARTDPVQLERILRNLIENAIRYTHRGGLLIAARRHGGRPRVEIVDSGIGIPTDKLEHIYEEFYQVANPARDHRLGLGLGLSIAHRLARLIGVDLRLRSVVGRGTWFTVTMPGGIATSEPAARPMATAIVSGRRILLIEDNPKVRTALQLLLESWNCAVLGCETGEEALEAAARADWNFDVIVADHRLGGGMTGTTVATAISARAGRRIPTLIITGDTAPERITEVQASGFAMLHKPVTPDKLARELAALLPAE